MSMTLLDEVVRAHGGHERWSEVRQLNLKLRIGGNLLMSKFASPRTRALDVLIDTRRFHIAISPFPKEGMRGVFDGELLRVETEKGDVVRERRVVRDSDGKVVRRLVWDDLDVLYFFGYALWNYTTTPYHFLWPGFEVTEGAKWGEEDGFNLRRLHVRYPHSFPTHCREQTFFFDERGLLRRLDYTAEVFGDFAKGAHYCEEHREFDGLIFPTHRVVYPRKRNGRPMRLFTAMEGWIDHVSTL